MTHYDIIRNKNRIRRLSPEGLSRQTDRLYELMVRESDIIGAYASSDDPRHVLIVKDATDRYNELKELYDFAGERHELIYKFLGY